MKSIVLIPTVILLMLSGCAILGEETDSGMTFGEALLTGAAVGLGSTDSASGAASAAMMASSSRDSSSYDQPSARRVAPRQGNCLRLEREEAWGGMTFLKNSCAMDLDVKYCFGRQNAGCETRIGSTNVPAYDRKTVYYEKNDGYDRLSFIYYACDSSDDACFDTLNDYAEKLRAQSPRI